MDWARVEINILHVQTVIVHFWFLSRWNWILAEVWLLDDQLMRESIINFSFSFFFCVRNMIGADCRVAYANCTDGSVRSTRRAWASRRRTFRSTRPCSSSFRTTEPSTAEGNRPNLAVATATAPAVTTATTAITAITAAAVEAPKKSSRRRRYFRHSIKSSGCCTSHAASASRIWLSSSKWPAEFRSYRGPCRGNVNDQLLT